MEGVKCFHILVFVFAAIGAVAANTFVGPRIANSCSSSSDLILTVSSSNKVAPGARVDVYRQIDNGERITWTGVTASDGTAKPPVLEPGIYRVFVDAGDRIGEMSLLVGQFKGSTKCSVKMGIPYSTEAGSPMPEQPSELRLKAFRGIVVDEKGAPLPHVIVRVLPNGSPTGYLAQFQSDDKGTFEFHLNPGSYSATFSYQGYRTRWFLIHIGSGWSGSELTLIPEDSAVHDPPTTEWTMQ